MQKPTILTYNKAVSCYYCGESTAYIVQVYKDPIQEIPICGCCIEWINYELDGTKMGFPVKK